MADSHLLVAVLVGELHLLSLLNLLPPLDPGRAFPGNLARASSILAGCHLVFIGAVASSQVQGGLVEMSKVEQVPSH